MQKTFAVSVAFLTLTYLLYLAFTINIAPLPWFDEVFFSSISKSFLDNGNFIASVSETIRGERESLAYGPIYFWLNSFLFKTFGFGIWQGRIINALAGIGTIVFTALNFKDKEKSLPFSLSLGLTFLLDPLLHQTLTGGRMDWLAILLVLFSLYFLKKADTKEIVISSFFALLALLTTPRSGILLVPLLVFAGLSIFKKPKQLQHFTLWIGIIVLIYMLWIFYAFGGIIQMVNFYSEMAEGYLGGKFYIPKGQWPVIIVFLLSLIYAALFNKKRFQEIEIQYSFLVIILFYLLIRDWGLYSVFILPFYYFSIFTLFYKSPYSTKLHLAPLALLLTVNLSYSFLKGVQILADKGRRNPSIPAAFLKKNIPPGAAVIGDALYFYPAIAAKTKFELFDAYGTLPEREEKHRMIFNYDYIIISKQSIKRTPWLVNHYMEKAVLVPVDSLISRQTSLNKVISSSGLVSDMEDGCYDAVIYKRIK